MAGRKTSVYLSEELSAQVEASAVPLAELIRRGLAAGEPEPIEATLARVVRSQLDVGPPPWWDETELSEEEQRAPVCERCGTALACPQCYRGD